MYLVISEKPSVAQSIGKVLGAYKKEQGYLSGRDCIISWCLGHLAEYAMPESYDEAYKKWSFEDLPILPEKWKLELDPDKKKQFTVLKKLLSRTDLDYVVNACDAGREGELIFKRVYDLSESRVPVKRLWISSMEDTAVKEGFDHFGKRGGVSESGRRFCVQSAGRLANRDQCDKSLYNDLFPSSDCWQSADANTGYDCKARSGNSGLSERAVFCHAFVIGRAGCSFYAF